MTELKPCPCCGVKPNIYRYPFNDSIRCDNQRCPVQPSIGISHEYCKHSDEAIDKWNIRDGETNG